MRIQWENDTWSAYADVISNQGNRDYFIYDDRHNLEKRKITGGAAEVEVSWKKPGEQFTLIGMMARGDEQLEDSSRIGTNYKRRLEGFYEISPGTYRGTQFYFNGGSPDLNSGTGLGHSINNTQLGGFRYRYDIPETTSVYRLGLSFCLCPCLFLFCLGDDVFSIVVLLVDTASMLLPVLQPRVQKFHLLLSRQGP